MVPAFSGYFLFFYFVFSTAYAHVCSKMFLSCVAPSAVLHPLPFAFLCRYIDNNTEFTGPVPPQISALTQLTRLYAL